MRGKQLKFNNNGFSLMELMVAASIMAIIYMIAIPNYKTFKAKARQKEGFHLLATFYSSATATRSEFGLFPGNLVETGFAPGGLLGYRLRSNDGNDTSLPASNRDDLCIHTGLGCNCTMACPDFKTWQEHPFGIIKGRIGPHMVPNICPGIANLQTNDDSFSVRVAGVINLGAAGADQLGIDEKKTFAVCNDGTK